MIDIKQKGDFGKVFAYLNKVQRKSVDRNILEKYAQEGVRRLAEYTPKDTGLTASSWTYEINMSSNNKVSIAFSNTNINNGVPIAIILQLGHATGTGGWVEGIDYINPALQPVFKDLADDVWREVTKV